MVKQVFDNAQCAHVWASRQQENGRTSNSNFFFEGDVIYSYGYHFPLATYYTTRNGDSVIFINDDHYSSSTSGHQSYVRSAIRGERYEKISVNTAFIRALARDHRDFHKAAAQEYLESLVKEVEISTKRMKKSRKYGHLHRDKIGAIRAKASTLATMFGLRSNPVEKLITSTDIDSLADAITARQAEARKKEQAMIERDKKKALQLWLEEMPRWKAGQPIYLPAKYRPLLEDVPTALRLRDGRIETTRGAQVTEAAGCKLFKLWRAVMNEMDPFRPNTIFCKGMFLDCAETNAGFQPIMAKTKFAATDEEAAAWRKAWSRWEADHDVHRVDHWELRWIDAHGNTKIGCHLLTRAEIDDFLNRVGWHNEQNHTQSSR